jgi:hypothetical protein
VLACSIPVRGDITPIDPFQGDVSENFGDLGISGAQQEIRILQDTATVRNLTTGGALKLELSSSLDGDLVVPHSPPRMMGQIGISEWVFDTPLSQFGSYFENNSRFDDATVDFFDVNDHLIGSLTATDPKDRQDWTWNGWKSDVPIHRIVITGNDAVFFHGFIWFDDVQATFAPASVPEPSSLALLGSSGLIILLARRRRAFRSRII